MAALVDMVEIEEMHSKGDSVEDVPAMNGELTAKQDEDEQENCKNIVDSDADEPMVVCEPDETSQPDTNQENDTETNADSVHDENSLGNVCADDKNDQIEVHNIDNSDDEISEIREKQPTTERDDELSSPNNENSEDKNGVDKNTVLNDSSEADVMIVDNDIPKENGDVHIEISDGETPKNLDDPEIINLDETVKKKKNRAVEISAVTPRRSSRNVKKQKHYGGDSTDEDDFVKKVESEESDIEEVLPQDPLAGVDPLANDKPKRSKSSNQTIVVKDTKRLVEIAAQSSPTNSKKEPTLVIIDTNSILSGRGPVPVMQKPPIMPSSYNTLPMALPAQGMYPPNMRATITPIPISTPAVSSPKNSNSAMPTSPVQVTPPLLPTLTDDMFVVEAPSFIVPYVYEKPPLKDLKEFVKGIKKELEDARKKEEEEKKKEGEDKESKSEADEKEERKDDDDSDDVEITDCGKLNTYFDSPLGKFFIDIGCGLVQEYVQTDLLKQQKRKRDREGGKNATTNKTIQTLIKDLEYSKENNMQYHMNMKKCEFCSFKTESALAMAFHLETPHMKNFVYRCNFCSYEIRSPHDILLHMESAHGVRGRLERAPAFHQCPNCPFEDNQKGKLSRHLVGCMRKFRPSRNLEPPLDWEPPAKIPRMPRMKHQGLNATALYQAVGKNQFQFMNKMPTTANPASLIHRGRGRPTLGNNPKQQSLMRSPSMVYKQPMSGGSVLVPTSYQLSGNQLYQQSNSKNKGVHQPSISITPLPRTAATPSSALGVKPGDSSAKNSFVICEICDGYIKDLEQLRNHMQWIHKVKIHPKMIYNRPPLNCQKCQFRFFTDQGLERHLLGSHGLVTSSMQEAANKSKDSGRCPVCGRVYQWKLLNHVARDHNMTLKPAHLSYKCTVCTATFGMYKQFESHVYSAHSVVAKRVVDKKSTPALSKSDNALLKPLKINDEITIIPQPAKMPSNGASTSKEGSPASSRNNPSTSKTK